MFAVTLIAVNTTSTLSFILQVRRMRLRDWCNSSRIYEWQEWDSNAGMQRPGVQIIRSATHSKSKWTTQVKVD